MKRALNIAEACAGLFLIGAILAKLFEAKS